MKTTKIAKVTGKVMLAILGAILMPVLIWVALGAAIYQSHQRKAQAEQTPTLGQILAWAGTGKGKA